MIRQYTDTDVDAVVAVWRAASDFAHPFLSREFQDSEAENVRHVYPQFADIWVKEHDGAVIGFIALLTHEDGTHEVGAIFVEPERHGHGFGRELMGFALQLHGALILDVFKDNAVGRRFYDAYGFKITGEYLHEPSGQMTLKLAFTPSG